MAYTRIFAHSFNHQRGQMTRFKAVANLAMCEPQPDEEKPYFRLDISDQQTQSRLPNDEALLGYTYMCLCVSVGLFQSLYFFMMRG